MTRTLSIVAATLLFSATAFAQDEATMSGEVSSSDAPVATVSSSSSGGSKVGLGSQLTLVGIAGLDIVFHLQDNIFLEGMIGATNTSPDGGDSELAIAFGVGGFYQLFEKGPADLYIGGRLSYADDGADDGNSRFGIEFPLQVRLNVHSNLALHFETGVGIAMDSAGEADSTTFFIGGSNFTDSPFGGFVELLAVGGFTIYL